ncbi:MOB kinase activator family protein [Kipferlia bialata]|uniref:MOB kinase activator family protein n=1 Tax=Kipferlia bialata TaxID=797122 RepID=A0A9K3D3M5_9EUKA|nr:MOB kinase activator family protein [Kipferlia bialata]|eukprot:g9713.t1
MDNLSEYEFSYSDSDTEESDWSSEDDDLMARAVTGGVQRNTIPLSAGKFFGSIVRRLHRVFAHAYYHHRPQFDQFEAETHLCQRFNVFVVKFALMHSNQFLFKL